MPAAFVWLPACLECNNDFRPADTDMVSISMNWPVAVSNRVKRQKEQ